MKKPFTVIYREVNPKTGQPGTTEIVSATFVSGDFSLLEVKFENPNEKGVIPVKQVANLIQIMKHFNFEI